MIAALFDLAVKQQNNNISMNYFSQYISEVGFRFGLDTLFNCPQNQFYIGFWSINPPANFYQETPTFDKLVVFDELDFDSHVKTPKFKEALFVFSNVPVDYNTHLIIEIKAVRFNKDGKTEIVDFGWTIFPLFSVFEHEKANDNSEIFLRSGRHMIQLFDGGVRNDVVKSLKGKNSILNFYSWNRGYLGILTRGEIRREFQASTF